LRRLELHRACYVGELVGGEDELVCLQVEAQSEIFGEVGRQRLHVATLHELIDRLFLRHNKAGSTPLQCAENIRQDVENLLGRLELVVGVDIVDVVDGLLKMIGSVLDLLNLPGKVLSYGRALYHILLSLHLETDVLGRERRFRDSELGKSTRRVSRSRTSLRLRTNRIT
jgi:hypothetical protein